MTQLALGLAAPTDLIKGDGAPGAGIVLDEGVQLALVKADANGNFAGAKLTGDMTMKEGDIIRMRARYADGYRAGLEAGEQHQAAEWAEGISQEI